MKQPRIKGKKYPRTYVVGDTWWKNFNFDNEQYRCTTGVKVDWVKKPEGDDPGEVMGAPIIVRAQVPNTREEKSEAAKVRKRMRTERSIGVTELHAYAAEYLDRKPIPREIRVRRSLIGHLTNFFPRGMDLTDLDRGAAIRYHQYLGQLHVMDEIAGRTANMRIEKARALYNQALDDQRIFGSNPFSKLPKYPARRRTYVLLPEDEAILLNYCPLWLSFIILDTLYHGFRAAEVRMLRRTDFRPNEGRSGWLELEEGQTKGERLKASQGAADEGKRARIALIPAVRDRMRSMLRTHKSSYFYANNRGKRLKQGSLASAIRTVWAKSEPEIADRAEMSIEDFQFELKRKGGFSFHSLRHTAATRDAEAGYTEPELMAKYRWSSPKMVTRYIHNSDKWAEAAAHKRVEDD